MGRVAGIAQHLCHWPDDSRRWGIVMMSDTQILDARRLMPGLAAISFYAAHVWQWARLRKLENALWACHIGCLLIALGWITAWPLANAIGLLWLLPGILFWLVYLAYGGLFLWSSLF